MTDPPTPYAPAALLAAAARLGFIIKVRDQGGDTSKDLGVFADGTTEQALVVASGGIDGTWTLCSSLPAGFGPVLVYRAAFDVLHDGELNADGSISYEGQRYRVQSFFD